MHLISEYTVNEKIMTEADYSMNEELTSYYEILYNDLCFMFNEIIANETCTTECGCGITKVDGTSPEDSINYYSIVYDDTCNTVEVVETCTTKCGCEATEDNITSPANYLVYYEVLYDDTSDGTDPGDDSLYYEVLYNDLCHMFDKEEDKSCGIPQEDDPRFSCDAFRNNGEEVTCYEILYDDSCHMNTAKNCDKLSTATRCEINEEAHVHVANYNKSVDCCSHETEDIAVSLPEKADRVLHYSTSYSLGSLLDIVEKCCAVNVHKPFAESWRTSIWNVLQDPTAWLHKIKCLADNKEACLNKSHDTLHLGTDRGLSQPKALAAQPDRLVAQPRF
ncbi:7328_t:CDS:2 [Rhizophagus irregularis]|nr:7328_t:CDS:2 [Rhizophagus irregularis]